MKYFCFLIKLNDLIAHSKFFSLDNLLKQTFMIHFFGIFFIDLFNLSRDGGYYSIYFKELLKPFLIPLEFAIIIYERGYKKLIKYIYIFFFK